MQTFKTLSTAFLLVFFLSSPGFAIDPTDPTEPAPSPKRSSPTDDPAKPEEPTKPKEVHTYMYVRPVVMDVELGRIGKILHPTALAAFGALNTAVLYNYGGVEAGTLYLMWQAAKYAPSLAAQSAIDLKIRVGDKKAALLDKLEDLPVVEKITVLITGSLEFKGPLATRHRRRGVVFVQTSQVLNAEQLESLDKDKTMGPVTEVSSLDTSNLELKLSAFGAEHATKWTVSLKDVFDEKTIPQEIAKLWREHITAQSKTALKWWQRTPGKKWKGASVTGVLTTNDGQKFELGQILDGRDVAGLLKKPGFFGPKPIPMMMRDCERALTKPEKPRRRPGPDDDRDFLTTRP